MNPRLPNLENLPTSGDLSHSHPEDLLLDQILLDDAILPTSGFAASVLDAITAESSTPAPIPFPWKLALPILAAMLIALIAAIRLVAQMRHTLAAQPNLARIDLTWLAHRPLASQILPAAAALGGALLCLLLTRYLATGRSSH